MCVFGLSQNAFCLNYGLLNLVIFGSFLQCWVSCLRNQLRLQFSMDVSQTLQTYWEHIENVHVGF